VGFAVTGIDPVERHVEVARARRPDTGVTFRSGTAERIPLDDASADAIWCRDVLVHVADLPAAYAEFRRVLRPGGRPLVYQVFGTDRLEAREAAWLWDVMGVVAASADPVNTSDAIAAAGLRVDECIGIGTEWASGRRSIRASRAASCCKRRA
jgi:SAM-dependent methyltransferase